ncbi:N(4)-(beta-N-acetylglucosaminyl)-L-asparaginase, partial [bacterium]|nr:N(4)-(beta-N-acetylglucosaminyl)-L-asparaginase [bacterium]
YLAADKQGRCSAYSIQPGFQFAVMDQTGNRLLDAQSWIRPAAKAQE